MPFRILGVSASSDAIGIQREKHRLWGQNSDATTGMILGKSFYLPETISSSIKYFVDSSENYI